MSGRYCCKQCPVVASFVSGRLKVNSNQPRSGIRPELSRQIAILFNGNSCAQIGRSSNVAGENRPKTFVCDTEVLCILKLCFNVPRDPEYVDDHSLLNTPCRLQASCFIPTQLYQPSFINAEFSMRPTGKRCQGLGAASENFILTIEKNLQTKWLKKLARGPHGIRTDPLSFTFVCWNPEPKFKDSWSVPSLHAHPHQRVMHICHAQRVWAGKDPLLRVLQGAELQVSYHCEGFTIVQTKHVQVGATKT